MTPPLRLQPLRAALLAWYDAHRRRLPWREAPAPYRVLVSEIMLQQTQVSTVIPYFERWMQRFPTVEALAAAPIEDVLALWAGLGYYRRAHNLHRAAGLIVAQHGGVFPEDIDHVLALPGVGRYTAGAITSIAFGQQQPIVDGNVARVLCRLQAIEGDPTRGPTQRALWALSTKLVPKRRPGDFNQALMELGATLCTRANPDCDRCPWQGDCTAYRTGQQAELPTPRKRPVRKRAVAAAVVVVDPQRRVLLARRPDEGLWSGLWEPPTLELHRDPLTAPVRSGVGGGALKKVQAFARRLDLPAPTRPGAPIEHKLTHLDWTLVPWRVDAPKALVVDSAQTDYQVVKWVALEERDAHATSRPVSTLLSRVWGA